MITYTNFLKKLSRGCSPLQCWVWSFLSDQKHILIKDQTKVNFWWDSICIHTKVFAYLFFSHFHSRASVPLLQFLPTILRLNCYILATRVSFFTSDNKDMKSPEPHVDLTISYLLSCTDFPKPWDGYCLHYFGGDRVASLNPKTSFSLKVWHMPGFNM